MECEGYNGRTHFKPAVAARRARSNKLNGRCPGDLRLDCGPPLARNPPTQPVHLHLVSTQHQSTICCDPPGRSPFINNMDEISYWIYTKRAPCLMNYDKIKKSDEAQCSKPKQKSVVQEPSPKKKKKRKLSLLDDDSVSTEKQKVYFEVTQKQNRPVVGNCKSDTLGSDVDFNIKNSSMQGKRKKVKLQKSTRTTLHKKNKVVTSTPKVTNLRRSLRQAQQSLNNNSHFNSSFEIFMNGNNLKNNHSCEQKSSNKLKKPELLAGGDQTVDSKKNNINNKPKNSPAALNGQFEDLSDVSGFTANYIRSTKVQSNKTPRKLRCKPNRNLIKESKHASQKNGTMLVCVNKSLNTGLPKNVLDCSTDSSQNVINLVSKNKNDKSTKMSKSTSMLKFIDTRAKSKESVSNKVENGNPSKNNLNVSFQSKSSTSRYPTRYKNPTVDVTADTNQEDTESNKNAGNKRTLNKNSLELNSSDRKENPEEKVFSRTRSGRSIGLTLCQQENSVLVLSNSSEQISSMVSINVASPGLAEKRGKLAKKKRKSVRPVSKRLLDKSEWSVRRDSLRDKSGFAACFSDSDDDNEPLKQRKFFRA